MGCLLLAAIAPAQAELRPLTDNAGVGTALEIIDVWMDAQVAYDGIPGVSIGIVHDQDLIWSRGFGYAHVKDKVPATPATIYSICSISKLFTSIAVMQLRDQGKLRLDDAIVGHLPWFQIEDTYPDAPPVTIQGLLTHSSGLPREADFPYWTGPDYPFPTREQIIARISSQAELYPADANFQYSNLGLTMAGEIVAAVSGQPYAHYVQEHILQPLGMNSTTPEIPENHRGGRLATPYSRRGRDGERQAIDFYSVRGIAPAAGYASTVEDLARFASWQFRLLDGGAGEVLEANSLRQMHRVHFLDENWQTARGIGFSVSHREGKIFVGHGGSCPGYRTQLTMSPKDQIAVIFMTNGHDVSPGSYTQEIFDVIAPAISAALESPEKAVEIDPELHQYTGRYERPLGGETQVLIAKGQLVTLSLPTRNPSSLTKLQHQGGHVFRRVRDDGDLAETIVFELDSEGRVVRMVRNSNYSYRVH
jgi:CubicO group peptidase (beta-lactamase class C family)